MVIHLAAFNGTKHFYTKAYDVIRDNTLPTINLLDRYRHGVKRFVYAGTPESTAGATDLFGYAIPTDEECPLVVADPKNLRWSYAGSKALGEQAVIASGLPWTVIRYNNIYGPGQRDHFVSEFWERARNGVYQLYGYDNTRTFMYVADATEAVCRLIEMPESENEIINVGGDREITIRQAAEVILEVMGHGGEKIELHPAPAGSALRRCPDTTKMKRLTGMTSQTDLSTGMAATIRSLECGLE
jgi:nucleoside-diphosphate-sugar epimerase